MIRGANSEDLEVQTEAIILTVTLAFDTSNQGPYLARERSRIIAPKGVVTTYSLGQILDDENDGVYMQGWSTSHEEELSWVLFNNSTDFNSLSFTMSPPDDIDNFSFDVNMVLADDNLYQQFTELKFEVEVIENQGFKGAV